MAAILMAGAISGAVPARAGPEGTEKIALEKIAGKYLGAQYNWEGRLTNAHPGLDCLGLIFVSLEKKYGISWSNWSVKPSELIYQLEQKHSKRTILLFASDEDSILKKVSAGDLIFFLRPVVLGGDEKAAMDSSGKDYYVWHAAIYEGNGKIVHASSYPDSSGNETYRVTEDRLVTFMKSNQFDGLIAVTFSK